MNITINRELVEKAMRVCKKNAQLFSDLGINQFAHAYDEVRKSLYAIRLQEDFGIHGVTRGMVRHVEPDVYVVINEHMHIASMGEKYCRTIAWSADRRQPKDEIMLVLTFPTGAYIFGDSYPTALFNDMWAEIKTFNFKYVDDVNHNVYFSLDEAAPIANAFRDILQKYYKRFRDEFNVRRAAELRRELEKLEPAP